MSDADVFPTLCDALRRTFPSASTVQFTRDTTSADVNGWDSLSRAILIMNVEDAFGISLPLDKAYELADVGALADLVESCLGMRGTEKDA